MRGALRPKASMENHYPGATGGARIEMEVGSYPGGSHTAVFGNSAPSARGGTSHTNTQRTEIVNRRAANAYPGPPIGTVPSHRERPGQRVGQCTENVCWPPYFASFAATAADPNKVLMLNSTTVKSFDGQGKPFCLNCIEYAKAVALAYEGVVIIDDIALKYGTDSAASPAIYMSAATVRTYFSWYINDH